MQLREKLSDSPAIVVAICGVLLMGCAAYMTWWMWPQAEPELQNMVYFYDLNTGELLSVPYDTTNPFETDSGPYQGMPAGVRAYVFCCGNFKPGDEFFVGTLEVPVAAVPEEHRPSGTKEGDWLIRRPTDEKWYKSGSRESNKIMQELRGRCPQGAGLERLNPLPVEK